VAAPLGRTDSVSNRSRRRGGGLLAFWSLIALTVLTPLQVHRCNTASRRVADEERTTNNAVVALSRWHADGRVTFRPTAGGVTADLRVTPQEWSALTPAEQEALQRELRRIVIHGLHVNGCTIHLDAPPERGPPRKC